MAEFRGDGDVVENRIAEQEGYEALPKVIQKKLEWFKDQKIGVIFHWGLYAQAGIVESWQLSEEDDWARKHGAWRPTVAQIRKDYWALNREFNPVNFEAKKWAEACKKAGFRYMIFTTKHHDGFSMYDTAFSDYKLSGGDSAFKADPRSDAFREAASAFRKEKLAVGAYYSKPDWHSPYYWVPVQHAKGRLASYDPAEEPERWAKFNAFVTNQLTEISRNYGKLDILWLDGGWVNEANGGHHEFLDMDKIAESVRRNHPDLLIVDRSIGGKYENYVTPERKIPETVPIKAWESNIPLAKNWGYVPHDIYKPFEEILDSLVQIVCMGGNLILGVGPKPDGTLPSEALQLMEKLGVWLGKYAEGIYGTRPAKMQLTSHFQFTRKYTEIYGFIRSEELAIADLQALSALTDEILVLNTEEVLDLTTEILEIPKINERYTVIKFTKCK